MSKKFKKDLTVKQVLSEEEILKYDRMLKMKNNAKTTAGTVGVTTMLLSPFVSSGVSFFSMDKVDTNKMMEEMDPEAQKEKEEVEANIVYSDVKAYGMELDNVGELDKKEAEVVENTMLRPSNNDDVKVIHTAKVKEKEGEKVFDPYVTYEMDEGRSIVAVADGTIVGTGDKTVLEHGMGEDKYYTVLGNVDEQVKEGQKVEQGEMIGISGGPVTFAVAEESGKDGFTGFIHPNMFVDIEKSNDYRYNSARYYAQAEVKASTVASKEVEEKVKESSEEVKESDVLKGVEIQNEQQASLLTSSDVFYEDDVLPVQVLQGGKADVKDNVRELEPLVRESAKEYGIEDMTEFLLALMEHESGGREDILKTDPFQSSQSKSGEIGSIKAQKESIDQGVKYFASALEANDMFDPIGYGDVRLAIQSYNFGLGLAEDAKNEEVGYSVKYIQEKAKEFKQEAEARGIELSQLANDWRGEAKYGDFTYVAKIFDKFEPSDDWEEKAEKKEEKKREEIKEEKEKIEEEKKKLEEEKKEMDKKKEEIKEKEEKVEKEEEKVKNSKIENIRKSIEEDYKELNIDEMEDSNRLEGYTIVLDAGHGKGDPGAAGIDGKTTEAEINLVTTLKAEKALKKQGAEVILTRSTADEFMTPGERGRFATDKQADLFISFHNNAASPQATGVETLYEKGDERSRLFGEIMQDNLSGVLHTLENRGTKERDNLGVFTQNEQTAILLETGFMSNRYDFEMLMNDQVQQGIVNAVTKATVDYLDLLEEAEEEKEDKEEEKEVKKEEKEKEDKEEEKEVKKEEKEKEEKEEGEEVEKEENEEDRKEEDSKEEDKENKEEEDGFFFLGNLFD